MERQKVGIDCPEILKEKDAIAKLMKNLWRFDPLKVVVKPSQDIGGARGLSIVDNHETFKKAVNECKRTYSKTQ